MISFEEFSKQAENSRVITSYREIYADMDTPVSVYAKLRKESEDAFLFESVVGGEKIGRYSFIGFKPLASYDLNYEEDPYAFLEAKLAEFESKSDLLPFFHQGLVGFFSFESINRVEPSVSVKASNYPEMYMLLVGSLVVFDHLKHKIYIVHNSLNDASDLQSLYGEAAKNLNDLEAIVSADSGLKRMNTESSNESLVFDSNTGEEEFKAIVKKTKEHIYEGDIFQAVLSHKLSADLDVDPLDVYRVLRTVNPSPYLFLYNVRSKNKTFSLVGSSPEMLVKSSLNEGVMEAEIRPIAGTYKRTGDDAVDEAAAKELLQDPKEVAEHTMLVDLARNDLGRVCEPGSIHVAENMIIEKYSHVMHIVSSVKGSIKDLSYKSGLDLLRACFPAGTLSGAPKVEAIKIISELEKEARGPYGGTIGYFSLDGMIDTAIMIRTLLIEEDKVIVQAGAGIVADSEPDKEWQETYNKANALIKVLKTLDS